MKIVLYSTNSNRFDEKNCSVKNIPSLESQKKKFEEKYPDVKIICVTQKPALFLADMDGSQNSDTYFVDYDTDGEFIDGHSDGKSSAASDGKSGEKSVPRDDITEIFVAKIKSLKPDIAVAVSFWAAPYDWLAIKDSIIGERLVEEGIKVICNPVETAAICFDKNRTREFLDKNDFNIARGIFVDHDLFFCAGSRKDVRENVYKEYVFNRIKKMKFPLVIKDTVGLSSCGVDVVHTFGEAKNYLNSRRNSSSRIAEEFICGEHFGLEIYGQKNNYHVMNPFSFSLNQYGITSPKFSRKTGPLKSSLEEEYRLKDLKDEMLRLASLLEINGIAQVDLIYSEKKWFIIEINPRFSGMTSSYAAAMGLSIFEFIYKMVVCQDPFHEEKINSVVNEKYPVKSDNELNSLKDEPNVIHICQVEDRAARQIREAGYCEIISRSL